MLGLGFSVSVRYASPRNLTVVHDTSFDAIADAVLKVTPKGGRTVFTNGTFAYPADICAPSTVAAFQKRVDATGQTNQPVDTLIILINSDVSMRAINSNKGEPDAHVEPQTVRMQKVAMPVARQFPNLHVIVGFYDETEPRGIYANLAERNVPMSHIFKYGYGIPAHGEGAKEIVGAEHFDAVWAHPLPHQTANKPPYAFTVTAGANQTGIQTEDLTRPQPGHTSGYLTPSGKIAFPIRHPALARHTDSLLGRTISKNLKAA